MGPRLVRLVVKVRSLCLVRVWSRDPRAARHAPRHVSRKLLRKWSDRKLYSSGLMAELEYCRQEVTSTSNIVCEGESSPDKCSEHIMDHNRDITWRTEDEEQLDSPVRQPAQEVDSDDSEDESGHLMIMMMMMTMMMAMMMTMS